MMAIILISCLGTTASLHRRGRARIVKQASGRDHPAKNPDQGVPMMGVSGSNPDGEYRL
jgi:hypothetical protein